MLAATTSTFRLATRTTAVRAARTFGATTANPHNVQTLEDLDAVTAFRQDNPKSVLYFTAVWCPPCKQIKPVYHDLSSTTTTSDDKNIAFGLVDVDDNPDAAVEFQISSVPTFIFSTGTTAVERYSSADPHALQKNVDALAARE